MQNFDLILKLKKFEDNYYRIIRRARNLTFLNYFKINKSEIIFFGDIFTSKYFCFFLPKNSENFFMYSLLKEECFEINLRDIQRNYALDLRNYSKFLDKLSTSGIIEINYRLNRQKLFEYIKKDEFIILKKCSRSFIKSIIKEEIVGLKFRSSFQLLNPQKDIGLIIRFETKDLQDIIKMWPNRSRIGIYSYSRDEKKCLPFFESTIYQYSFLINALKEIAFPQNENADNLRDVLKNINLNFEKSFEIDEFNDIIKQARLDQYQKLVLEEISRGKKLIILKSSSGTGKTYFCLFLTWFLSQILNKKVLFVSHDHTVINNFETLFNTRKQSHLVCRIGNPEEAKASKMHFEHNNQYLWEKCCKLVDQNINNLKNNNDELKGLLKEWLQFLQDDLGKNIFRKLSFNSARVLLGTINGLEYYRKREILDYFLPFDYVIIDEASKIQLPMYLHVGLFSKNWIISGDPALFQPYIDYSVEKSEEIEPFYSSLENSFSFLLNKYNQDLKTIHNRSQEITDFLGDNLLKSSFQNVEFKSDEIFELKSYYNSGGLAIPIGSFAFIDTSLFQKTSSHIDEFPHKFSNTYEIQLILRILKVLNNSRHWTDEFKNSNKQLKIWVTSLYYSQLTRLEEEIKNTNLKDFVVKEFSDSPLTTNNNLQIKISPTRKFVSREADIVLWSISFAPKDWLFKKRGTKYILDRQFQEIHQLYFIPTHFKSKLIIIGWYNVFEKIGNKLKWLQQRIDNKLEKELLKKLINFYENLHKSPYFSKVRIKPNW